MKTTLKTSALATIALLSLTANAWAAGLELVGVNLTDHYDLTLKVGSLADLKKRLGAGYDETNEDTSFEKEAQSAGFTFTYSGDWTDSPLIPSHTDAPGHVESLDETSASGKRFSVNFTYKKPYKLSDGEELLTFAITPPPAGGWGEIKLTKFNLSPFTIETGELSNDDGEAPLASFTISNVPEPSTYLMMAMGLAAIGVARRTRAS